MAVEIDDFCKRFPALAKGLDRNQISTLLSILSTRKLPAGQTLITENTTSDTLYLLWDGRLKATLEGKDETIDLGLTLPGQWVGEVSMLDAGSATATITADQDSTLLALTAADFWALDAREPIITGRLLQALIKVLAERLRSSTEILNNSVDQLDEPHVDKSLSSLNEVYMRIFKKLLGTGGK